MRSNMTLSALLALAACGAVGGDHENASAEKSPKQVAAATPATLLQPGLWRTQVQMQIDAGTEIKSSDGTYTVAGTKRGEVLPGQTKCLTASQAAQPLRSFHGSGCNYDKVSVAEERISGTMVCTHSGEVTQYIVDGRHTRVDYQVTAKGQARGTSTSGDGFSLTLPMVIMTTSRRIGECTGNEKVQLRSPPPPPPPPGARDGPR